MAVRRFEDLAAWQLADQLKEEVFAFTAGYPASRDYKYCDQIRESARSAARNIAEGFGRYYHREFAHFLRIASASLQETKNHLRDARARGYLSNVEYRRLEALTLRAIKATNRFIAYLVRSEAPAPYGTDTNTRGPKRPESLKHPEHHQHRSTVSTAAP
jgi:four helix bundle protein